MAPFLRILTIIAFAAHSLLGCCLAHGDCRPEQESAAVDHCCDHSSSGQHDDEDGQDDEHGQNDGGRDRHESGHRHDHGKHHDHSDCVLGDLGCESKGSDRSFAFLFLCYCSVAEEIPSPGLLIDHRFCQFRTAPLRDYSRESLQVWHI